MRKPIEDGTLPDAPAPEEVNSERRTFLAGVLASVPAMGLLNGCGGDPSAPSDSELGLSQEALQTQEALEAAATRCRFFVNAHERARRRKLTAVHVGEENEHDIDGLMDTFARHTEVTVNGVPTTDLDAIRAGHVEGGFSHAPGALAEIRVVPQIEYITEEEIVFEGLLTGRHVGTVAGFPATNREVGINYVAFYRFDHSGKLVSERLTFNHGVLAAPPPLPPI